MRKSYKALCCYDGLRCSDYASSPQGKRLQSKLDLKVRPYVLDPIALSSECLEGPRQLLTAMFRQVNALARRCSVATHTLLLNTRLQLVEVAMTRALRYTPNSCRQNEVLCLSGNTDQDLHLAGYGLALASH